MDGGSGRLLKAFQAMLVLGLITAHGYQYYLKIDNRISLCDEPLF